MVLMNLYAGTDSASHIYIYIEKIGPLTRLG